MNILFLQPKEYFQELIVLEELPRSGKIKFGYPPLTPVIKVIAGYSVIFSCIDHDEEARTICRIAKKSGLTVIFLQDGVFDFTNSISNKLLISKNKVLLGEDCYTKIFFTDITPFDYFNSYDSKLELYWPIRMLSRRKPILMPSITPLFLITTANCPAFNSSELERLLDLIRNLTQKLDSYGIKYDYRVFDLETIKELNIQPHQNKISGSFEDCLGLGYNAVFSTPSSIINTAANFDIPVAVFDYRSSPIFSVAGWRIHGSVSIGEEIDSILEKTQSRMDYQRKMLPQHHLPDDIFDAPLSKIANQTNKPKQTNITGFTYITRLIYKRYINKYIKLKPIVLTLLKSRKK